MSFQVGYDQLGFPVEVVRDAGLILQSSPRYGFDDAGARLGWRLYQVGCEGPNTFRQLGKG